MSKQEIKIVKKIRAYYDELPTAPTEKDWEEYIEVLKEPMKSYFKKEGFEYTKNTLPFLRFFKESKDLGMRDYLRENLTKAEFEYYLKNLK